MESAEYVSANHWDGCALQNAPIPYWKSDQTLYYYFQPIEQVLEVVEPPYKLFNTLVTNMAELIGFIFTG